MQAPEESGADPSREPVQKPGDVLDYATPGSYKRCAIARFEQELSAHLAASKLESEGISCQVSAATMLPNIGGATWLWVGAEDVQRAIEVLAQTPARRYLRVPQSELPPIAAAPADACPKCGCTDFSLARRYRAIVIGLAIMAPLLLLGVAGRVAFLWAGGLWTSLCLIGPPRRCAKCGHKWRAADEDDETPEKRQTS